ncbi:MAG: cysteine desulfurase family protein [Acutalibacteraceae bacterium]|nr:cysteine desulfurase family protein [Acutalibacteraceae bacterium]
MEHIAYLDNSSTTKPSKRAVQYITRALESNWGNPSSLHRIGMEAEIALNDGRECIAHTVNARADEIFFTGSGTEANNTALLSVLKAKSRGGRIITTAIEHPSVLETAKRLEAYGFEVVYLKPDNNGIVPLSELENALTDNTLLVSMMLVNNETGAVQPVEKAVSLTKRIAPLALFHCDAVQGYGKLSVNVKRLGVDLLSASGHKIHGPKGIGFLYCKKGVHISPLITGGGQERGMRSGTESTPLIMGLMGAAEELPKPETQFKIQQELFDYTRDRLLKIGAIINSPEGCLPYILNISLVGYRSETLLHFLESRNVFVSSGSACAKGHGSYVLNQMGLEPKRVDSALRISFSRYNTKEDADMLVSALEEAKKQLRKAN